MKKYKITGPSSEWEDSVTVDSGKAIYLIDGEEPVATVEDTGIEYNVVIGDQLITLDYSQMSNLITLVKTLSMGGSAGLMENHITELGETAVIKI